MKTKTTILIFLTAVSIAHANLIDLTPGGFDLTQPLPIPVSNYFGQYGLGLQNLAGANVVNGQPVWSPFTIFGDDRFNMALNALGTGADVSWDLSGTPWHLRFILTEGPGFLAHLYAPVGQEQITGGGFIEIDGITSLGAGTFAGSNTIPDTGSTLALMSIGLVGLFFLHRKKQP